MIWLLGLLTGNPVTRLLVKIAVGLLFLFSFGKVNQWRGASGQRAKEAEARTKTIQKAEEVENAVDAKTDAAVRGDLGRWVRPD